MSDLPPGFVALPPKGDKPEGFRAEAPSKISDEDRRAYTEAAHTSGQPESMKKMKAIEDKYGGRDAFIQMYDPVGEAMGKAIPGMALIAAGAGAPGAVAAGASGLAGALTNPTARNLGTEALKWLGRGALGAAGWETVKKVTGH